MHKTVGLWRPWSRPEIDSCETTALHYYGFVYVNTSDNSKILNIQSVRLNAVSDIERIYLGLVPIPSNLHGLDRLLVYELTPQPFFLELIFPFAIHANYILC